MIGGIFLILFGMTSLFISFIAFMIEMDTSKRSGKAVATIVNIETAMDNVGIITKPVVEFYHNGNKYISSHKYYKGGKCKYKVGDKAKIEFDIECPKQFTFEKENVCLKVFKVMRAIGLILIDLGVLCIALGIMSIVRQGGWY